MVEDNRYCAVCVNDMHLVVMLMPYIEKELEKGEKIVTIFEKSLKEKVDLFYTKVNLENSKKTKLKKIEWTENTASEEEIFNMKNKIVLVKGSYEYINKMNMCLNDKVNKVINCFELDIFEKNSREILKCHDYILNTLGVKKISDMFHAKWYKNSILT